MMNAAISFPVTEQDEMVFQAFMLLLCVFFSPFPHYSGLGGEEKSGANKGSRGDI